MADLFWLSTTRASTRAGRDDGPIYVVETNDTRTAFAIAYGHADEAVEQIDQAIAELEGIREQVRSKIKDMNQ